MKICQSCLISKPLEDFHFRTKSKDGRQSRCKCCNREQRKAYYKTAHGKSKNTFSGKRWGIKTRRKIYEYLLNHPCIDCGEKDPVVLEFDHINPSEKKYTISQYINIYSFDRLLEEINKCEIRCSNCHRKRTARQFGWNKMSWEPGPLA